ncbi:MarR family winged helix-turn-helix transcriptional regulator [Streptomyces sp. NPDC059373]
MPDNPAPRPSFGRALGEAARQMTKLHRRALTDFDSDFPSWMLYTLLKEKGVPLRAEEIAAELELRMDLAEPGAFQVLDRAAAAGHITFQPDEPAAAITLTQAGAAHFASLYAHARETTDRAVEGIDPAMLETALTVLLAVDERATAQLG